jgi:hypothetical protein
MLQFFVMENGWNPCTEYPELTKEYLSIVGDTIRRARTETLKLYDPAGGDDPWSHGCRASVRSVFALRQAAKKHTWLTIVQEEHPRRATFAIRGRPWRFYRGYPADPPSNYLGNTFAEIRQLQWVLKLDGLPPIDKLLRIAVETNAEGDTTDITLVELDEVGNVTNSYVIPKVIPATNVIPAQAPAIEVLPPRVEPKKTAEQKQQEAQQIKKKKNE